MNWPLVKLENLGEFKNGVNFKADRMGSGISLINVKDITTSYRMQIDSFDLVDVEYREDDLAKEEDIFFVRSSVKLEGIGLVAKNISLDQPVIHCGFVIRFRPTYSDLNSEYLLYLLLCRKYRELIKNLSSGATIINLSQGSLKTLEVPIPSIKVQNKIVDILSSYDKLIENNQRRINLLEEAARQIYTEWFIRLRYPGYEKCKIFDGLPKDWKRIKLDNVCAYINRGVVPKYAEDAEKKVINQKCIRNFKIEMSHARCLENELPEEKYVRKGDVLINSTGVGTLGRVAQVREKLKNVTVDTHVSIVRPIQSVNPWFFGMQMESLQSYYIQQGEGATNQSELKRDRIKVTKFLYPKEKTIREYGDIVEPMLNQIGILSKQNVKLSSARDILLPKLMSDQLKISQG